MEKRPFQQHISNEDTAKLPAVLFEGPIVIVDDEKQVEAACRDLASSPVLGFDTETRPSFRKGRVNTPSLVQLATARAVYLVQLSWWPFGPELAGLLADPAVIKAGVAIGDDMRELARLYPFKPAGMVDLGMVARAHQLTTQGLRTLAANLFGQRISKGPQCSNWSVMELSKVTSGALKCEKVHFDMGQLCDEVSERYDAVCAQNGWQLKLELPDEELPVYADPNMMQRALHNLLGNAMHHMGADGIFVLRAAPSAEGVRVEVEDHGPGIAAEDLPYIFDRYYRSRSDAGKQGTGLGLSITKAIFQQHGFRFGVQSTLGKGTTFWFIATDTK